MKNKIVKTFVSLALTPIFFIGPLLMTGCGTTTPTVTPALVQTAVTYAVEFGVQKYPQAVPPLRIAGPVICLAAGSTNVSPAEVVAALQAAGVSGTTNQEAAVIIDGALALYESVFATYGTNWYSSVPQLQSYLTAVCQGIENGLPPLVAPNAVKMPSWQELPPHL